MAPCEAGLRSRSAVECSDDVKLHGEPIYARFVRLTHEQWEQSVRDLLGLAALPDLSDSFTSDPPSTHGNAKAGSGEEGGSNEGVHRQGVDALAILGPR